MSVASVNGAEGSILVVDDHRDVREVLCDFLAGEGFQVRGAGGGGAALAELAANAIPDVVLLDLDIMTNGYEFLRKQALAEDDHVRQVPVVALSSVEHGPLPFPVASVVAKPVNLDLLLRVVRREVLKGLHV